MIDQRLHERQQRGFPTFRLGTPQDQSRTMQEQMGDEGVQNPKRNRDRLFEAHDNAPELDQLDNLLEHIEGALNPVEPGRLSLFVFGDEVQLDIGETIVALQPLERLECGRCLAQVGRVMRC
jgi:hypothetical protein